MVEVIALPGLAIEGQQIGAIRRRQRPPIRAGGEIEQGLQVTRLRLAAGSLDPADALVGRVEEVLDRLDRHVAAALGDFQIIGLQLPELRLRDDLLHLDLSNLGLAVFEVVSRSTGPQLGEFDVRPDVDGSNEIHLPPHLVQGRLLLLVQQQLIERLVVAKVAHDVVEARTQIAALISARPEIISAARFFVEHVGKDAAKPTPRRFVACALTGRNEEIRIAGLIFDQDRLAWTERIIPFGLDYVALVERRLALDLQLPEIELSAMRRVLRIFPNQ